MGAANDALVPSLSVPSRRRGNSPGFWFRSMAASAYQQLQPALWRNDSSCCDQTPRSPVTSAGAFTRNNTGEPLTNSCGSVLTVHATATGKVCAPASDAAKTNSAILTKPNFIGGRLVARRLVSSLRPAAEDERAVGAAKAEGIGERNVHRRLARHVGNIVQVAFRVWVFQIDGGRKDLVAQGQDGNAGFQAARAAQQMSGHGLGGANRNLSVGAESTFDGFGFKHIADGR